MDSPPLWVFGDQEEDGYCCSALVMATENTNVIIRMEDFEEFLMFSNNAAGVEISQNFHKFFLYVNILIFYLV